MNSSKLLTLIKSLTDNEIREFHKYLRSPFFNHDKNIIVLYTYIRRFHPFFESTKLEKEKVYKKVFKKAPYVQRKMNDVMSDLCLKLEDYMMLKELKKHPAEKDLLLLRSFEARKLNHYFFKGLEKAKNRLEKSPKEDMDYYYYQFMYASKGYLHEGTSLLNRANQKIAANYLHSVNNNLDRFYFGTKLRFYKEVKINKKITDNEYETPLIPEIVNEINKTFDSYSITTQLYTLLYQLQEDKNANDATYTALKKLTLASVELIDREELHEILLGLIHYSNTKMKSGIQTFESAKEILAVFKLQIKYDLLIFDGLIAAQVFQNIVNIATGLGELDWAEQFIHQFSKNINEKEKNDVEKLCMASVHFWKKNYRDAIQAISLVSNKEYNNAMATRIVEIQSYFELQDIVSTSDCCDRFQRYLHRKKGLSDGYKKALLNFISVIRKLIKVNAPSKKEMLLVLEGMPMIFSRAWLLQKIDQLK